jgi:hypothetical protein
MGEECVVSKKSSFVSDPRASVDVVRTKYVKLRPPVQGAVTLNDLVDLLLGKFLVQISAREKG